jgi:hypothetical protein
MAGRIAKILKRTILAAALLGAATWACDWAILRLKITREMNAFGSVDVHRRYALQLKNRRIEQLPEYRGPEECVRSLFPHYDESPCWYLESHAEQIETLDGSPWRFFKGE